MKGKEKRRSKGQEKGGDSSNSEDWEKIKQTEQVFYAGVGRGVGEGVDHQVGKKIWSMITDDPDTRMGSLYLPLEGQNKSFNPVSTFPQVVLFQECLKYWSFPFPHKI